MASQSSIQCEHPAHGSAEWAAKFNTKHYSDCMSRIRPVILALAALVTPSTVDNHAMMALRWIIAYDIECLTDPSTWRAIVNRPSCHSFSTCAHCSARLFQWNWKRWRPWFLRLTYFPQATFGHWTNQIPPTKDSDAALQSAYSKCIVMGMRSDDYGQFIPGRTTNWREYQIRSTDSKEDQEIVDWLKWGISWGFDATHQPPTKETNVELARTRWNALNDDTKARAREEWAKNTGTGDFEGRACRWEYPLNFPPTHGVTPQYEITKKELELRLVPAPTSNDSKTTLTPPTYEAIEHDKRRVISNVAKGGCNLNDASPIETVCTYSTPDTMATNAQPGGTLVRVDEPDAFLHQGTVYREHSAVTIIIPGSFDNNGDEEYAQSPQWVFGGKAFPRFQMAKGRLHLRMRLAGFGETDYQDKVNGAKACDPTGAWTDLIMDDYGTTWVSLKEARMQADQLHKLLTILGPSSKLKKLVMVSFAAELDVLIDTSFGGAAFYLYHPMYKVAFYATEQRKVIKYVFMAYMQR
jgi:hypothetical protein